jgi:hypothetical protein
VASTAAATTAAPTSSASPRASSRRRTQVGGGGPGGELGHLDPQRGQAGGEHHRRAAPSAAAERPRRGRARAQAPPPRRARRRRGPALERGGRAGRADRPHSPQTQGCGKRDTDPAHAGSRGRRRHSVDSVSAFRGNCVECQIRCLISLPPSLSLSRHSQPHARA